jgi:transposase-like protein
MDTIESIKTEIRHKKWREMYEAYLSSGQTVTEWCAENGVTRKTFYYRLRQIRNEAIDQIEQHDIVPVTSPPPLAATTNGTIRISSSGIDIEFPADISPDMVTAAIRGLRIC